MLNTVKVPKEYEPLFLKAQDIVSSYFSGKQENPEKGTIEIDDERYIYVRAASMSVDFFETVKNLYKDSGKEEAICIARQILYDVAYAIGLSDAKNFQEKLKLKTPIERLSAGLVLFAYAGWANVDIFPESKPSQDEDFYLIYDHPYSFESDAWKKSGKKTDYSVCVLNAGYSSGWCSESFGVNLVVSEIMCKAKGDDVCRFIMAHPSKIDKYIKQYMRKEPELAKNISRYEVPGFFKRKELEDTLREKTQQLEKSLTKSIKAREVMVSMLEDNNRIREELENKFVELKQAEEMLIQTEKLASLGKLIADIAHEVNNPLMVISGKAQLALMEKLDNDEVNKNLKIIMDQCMRAKDIIQRLLTFSKPSHGDLSIVKIDESIEFILKLLEHQYYLSNVTIKRNYCSPIPEVRIDEKKMHEVYINLLKNAAEAMGPDGGTITINIRAKEKNLYIEFVDTGSGMTDESKSRVFEPFYTTKEKGTGLGLSVCYGIVKAHGGDLRYESTKEEGAKATIVLPIQ